MSNLFNLNKQTIDALKSAGVSLRLGVGQSIPRMSRFESPCSIKWMALHGDFYIGAYSYAVSGFFLNCKIGRYCSIGESVQIGRGAHPFHWVSTSPFFYTGYGNVLDETDQFVIDKFLLSEINVSDFIAGSQIQKVPETIIENDVWIGHGAFLKPGVTVHSGSVIAAYAVVTKDVPAFSIVAGNPAKIVRMRFSDEIIEKLLSSQWWNYHIGSIKANIINVDEFLSKLDRDKEAEKLLLIDNNPIILDDLIVE